MGQFKSNQGIKPQHYVMSSTDMQSDCCVISGTANASGELCKAIKTTARRVLSRQNIKLQLESIWRESMSQNVGAAVSLVSPERKL